MGHPVVEFRPTLSSAVNVLKTLLHVTTVQVNLFILAAAQMSHFQALLPFNSDVEIFCQEKLKIVQISFDGVYVNNLQKCFF